MAAEMRSAQPTPQPHSTGMAATSAIAGTMAKMYTATCAGILRLPSCSAVIRRVSLASARVVMRREYGSMLRVTPDPPVKTSCLVVFLGLHVGREQGERVDQ